MSGYNFSNLLIKPNTVNPDYGRNISVIKQLTYLFLLTYNSKELSIYDFDRICANEFKFFLLLTVDWPPLLAISELELFDRLAFYHNIALLLSSSLMLCFCVPKNDKATIFISLYGIMIFS